MRKYLHQKKHNNMHCTINRKYLRYFERNPRNIVNICANIYGIFNGFERGLLPYHWRVRYCVFFLTKNFPTFQCQSAGILQSKHTKGCLGPCFHWFLNPKLLTTKKRFLFLSGRKVHSELQEICFLSHFPLWRNWCFVCHCQ